MTACRTSPEFIFPVLLIFFLGLALRYAMFVGMGFETSPSLYLEKLCIWSCEWYASIVNGGYDQAVRDSGSLLRANWAFFPLYPLLVWLVTTATGLPFLISGFLISNALVVGAAVCIRPLFDQSRAYWLFVFALLAGPFSFLFSTLYSESLFIFLTVLGMLALQRSRYGAASLVSALLSATRPTGVLFVLAIAAQMLLDHLRSGGKWSSFPKRLVSEPSLLLPLLLSPLGLLLFMSYLYFHVGDALAFFHIQRGWDRELGNPLEVLSDVLRHGSALHYSAMVQLSWAAAAVIGLLLSAPLAFRGRPAIALFCFLCLVVSLSTGVTSMVRFVAGLAPLGLVTAELVSHNRATALAAAILAAATGMILTMGRLNQSMFAM